MAKRKAKVSGKAKLQRRRSRPQRGTAKRRKVAPARIASVLSKRDPSLPALKVLGASAIAIRAGTIFNGRRFKKDTPVTLPPMGLVAGTDYVVVVSGASVIARVLETAGLPLDAFGGFHYAPGGNAPAREGGNVTPAINPNSLWDRNFGPACPDVRGMTLVTMPDGKRFWCDIYLTGADHLSGGTSRFGVTIADGSSLPQNTEGSRFERFDYAAAVAVMKLHGKQLLSYDEFRAAAFGVVEKTARKGDPVTTQCDAAHTSRDGVMQATGNLWVWGHDGDPDNPRASLFGGSWFHGGYAGSRRAYVAYVWPGSSYENIGARGRSDHLQLGSPPRQRRRRR